MPTRPRSEQITAHPARVKIAYTAVDGRPFWRPQLGDKSTQVVVAAHLLPWQRHRIVAEPAAARFGRDGAAVAASSHGQTDPDIIVSERIRYHGDLAAELGFEKRP